MHQIWDVIIIGGGITGAGIFRDLAAQGYQVLLIDQNDFGFGSLQAVPPNWCMVDCVIWQMLNFM